jgi:hypothetical protein
MYHDPYWSSKVELLCAFKEGEQSIEPTRIRKTNRDELDLMNGKFWLGRQR